jgi:hypothetical protein
VTRFCANCGTEVDDNAVFCPTCGQAIDQEVESEMPPAPSWPEPTPRAPQAGHQPFEPDEDDVVAAAPPRHEDPDWASQPDVEPIEEAGEPAAEPGTAEVTRVVEPPPPPAAPAPGSSRPGVPPPPPREPAGPAMDIPLTMPVTLSAWLIGGGAALGAIGALIGLFDGLGTAIDLLLLIGLLGVAATVFLSDRLPHVPQLRLITLAVVLVAFGVALDRLGFGRAGAGDLLLFLGTAAAAIGAIILETGRDQPLGGPSA